MKKPIHADIQLVITVALKKEIPRKWLESHHVPVHTLAALDSGALARLDNTRIGILAVITGPGLKASEEAACWIRDNLKPQYVINTGTCGLLNKKYALCQWVQPRYVSNESCELIELDNRLPVPCPDKVKMIHSLFSVRKAAPDIRPEASEKPVAVDMECFAQAKIFSNTDISFHCLKFSTDYCDHNTSRDFNENLLRFQTAFTVLFSFLEEDHSQITVIVPVYNRRQTIRQALDSVLSQSRMPEEIIVVDDCSTDGTREILESYGDAISRIFLLENAGPSRARNEGVRHARTEWVAFLDSDDRWERHKLRDQIMYLDRHPWYQIIQSDEKWIRNGKRVNPCKHHQKPSGWIFGPSLERCLVSPSGVLLNKSLFKRYGGFDESFPVCEDYDLWLKISRNHPVGLDPALSVIKYGGHKDQLSGKFPAMDRYRIRSLVRLLQNESIPYFRGKIINVLKNKLDILIKGYEKRQNHKEIEECRKILGSLNEH